MSMRRVDLSVKSHPTDVSSGDKTMAESSHGFFDSLWTNWIPPQSGRRVYSTTCLLGNGGSEYLASGLTRSI